MLRRPRKSFARRKYRAHLRRFLRRNCRRLLVGTAIFVGTAAVMPFLVHGYLLGITHGVLACALVGMVLTVFHASTGSMNQLAGAWGEDNTADELRRAKRRRLIWGWVNNVETGSGDVDHLVITRHGGLVAIDSKWHRVGATSELLRQDAEAALAACRRASSILRAIKMHRSPTPLVVLWGGIQQEVPDVGAELHGVEFIGGRQLLGWLRQHNGDEIDRETAQQVLAALRRFKERVRPEYVLD